VPTLNPQVWDLVCLAAHTAMDSGRRRMVQIHLSRSAHSRRASYLVSRGSATAIASFWKTLARYAGGRHSLSTDLPQDHPFLGWLPATQRFRVNHH
jgi:hypothetical protein